MTRLTFFLGLAVRSKVNSCVVLRNVHHRSIATFIHESHAAALSLISSDVDTSSTEFEQNTAEYGHVQKKMQELHQMIEQGGSTKAREKHIAKGKMLPRDRLTALIDPGTSFLELSPLAGHDMYPGEDVPSAGIITGIGVVEGISCVIIINDSTVKGGTYYPSSVKKHVRAQEIARQNRLPCIYLVDSGGANLPHQADVFPDRDHFGRIFYNQAQMSAMGIPQISVVMGPCTAGGAYVPSMSDESIIVENQGTIFLAGPPLVKAATGEIVSAEDLGGGRLHSSVSGVTDYLARDDTHALVLARRCISNLNYPQPPPPTEEETSFPNPLYPPSTLTGLLSLSLRSHISAYDILARLTDGSLFQEFKSQYGTTLVTGFARIHGHQVGILCSNGPLYSESALKGAHFIQLCNQRDIPLVFFQNISGFMVGSEAERGGIAKHGAKLVTAVACSHVPKFTVVFGNSAGAGNYGMCGRAYSPNFLWTWPGSRTSVMGSEQLSAVMENVGGGNNGDAGKEKKKKMEGLKERIERESEAVYGSARLWDDGVIPPESTRGYLAKGLGIVKQAREWERIVGGREKVRYGVFRM